MYIGKKEYTHSHLETLEIGEKFKLLHSIEQVPCLCEIPLSKSFTHLKGFLQATHFRKGICILLQVPEVTLLKVDEWTLPQSDTKINFSGIRILIFINFVHLHYLYSSGRKHSHALPSSLSFISFLLKRTLICSLLQSTEFYLNM